ncbi:MAG: phage major capsid protein, partial [Methylomicrobium sp.]|nr:phage major capsid protein [Methylomicrobium sp.]
MKKTHCIMPSLTALIVFALGVIAFNVEAIASVSGAVPAIVPDIGAIIAGGAGIAFAGIGDVTEIGKKIELIENKINDFADKASKEIADNGKVSTETQNAINTYGEKQREIADRLLLLEQRGVGGGGQNEVDNSWGSQFVKSNSYEAFAAGNTLKARFEVQNNTLTGSETTVAPDRKPGIVPGPFGPLTLESLFPSMPTSSNAIEFTKENSFTNSAAETAEGALKPESALIWTLVNMPISTVAHWLKISKQLAADAPALAAYVNNRMVYGVNRRVETQLAVGDGTAPNISGIFDTGNFTAHGYADAALGTVLKKLVLIRRIMADLWAAGYMPDAILMNPADAAQIDIDVMTTTSNGIAGLMVDSAGVTRFRGVPIIQSIGVAADTFAVGAFNQAGVIHNRSGVVVELSDSDGDNFQ